jgi:importin subunit alpha-2
MRRRRKEVSVELRKARKDDQLLKRRNLSTEDDSILPLQENSRSPTSLTIEEIIEGIVSNIVFVNLGLPDIQIADCCLYGLLF